MSRNSPAKRVNDHSRDGWAIEANERRVASRRDPILRISEAKTGLEAVCLLVTRAYIRELRTAVYRLLAKHTSGRKPTF